MRIHVSHQTVYDYAPATKSLIQTLRLTPRNHDGQFVVHWRIGLDADSRLKPGEDAFGNITHLLSIGGPLDHLTVTVDGEVETHDTAGVIRGTVERFPPALFLRDTPLTETDDAVRDMAETVAASAGADTLTRLHALMARVHADLAHDPASGEATAPQAWKAGRGDCAAHGHVFVAAARHIGIPARVISGYVLDEEPAPASGIRYWAEAHVAGLGWVAFDTRTGVCPTVAHVRVAAGLDATAAAPVRGAHHGLSEERRSVAVKVMAQNQSQS